MEQNFISYSRRKNIKKKVKHLKLFFLFSIIVLKNIKNMIFRLFI